MYILFDLYNYYLYSTILKLCLAADYVKSMSYKGGMSDPRETQTKLSQGSRFVRVSEGVRD